MPSQIITPPDVCLGPNNYLIINAVDRDLESVILWLKTIPDTYNLHLYHSLMNDCQQWLYNLVKTVELILVNKQFEMNMAEPLRIALAQRGAANIRRFGENSDYPELIHYFLKSKI